MTDHTTKHAGTTLPKSLAMLGILFIALLLLNILFSGVRIRWDATSDKIHSLSPGTRTILAKMEEPVSIRYYFSNDPLQMPVHFRAFGRRAGDLLKEYEESSGGKIQLEIIHPKPDSEEEDWARTYGIEPLPTPGGENLYLGLVAISGNREQTIAFMDPARETSLEYDITRTLTQISRAEKPQVGILSGLNIYGNHGMPGMGGSNRWFFLKEMEKTVRLHTLNGDDEHLPEKLDLLILFQPDHLSPSMLHAIDSYVSSGGNLMVFNDPAAVSDPMYGYGPTESPLAPLFEAWGLEKDDRVVVDFHAATRLMGQNNQVEHNPSWLSLDASAMNSTHLLTASLNSLLLPMAGTVSLGENSPLTAEVLVSSSENAALFDPVAVRMGVESIRRSFAAEGKSYPLAMIFTGQFPVTFPDGPPEEKGIQAESIGEGTAEKADDREKEDGLADRKAAAETRELKPATLIYIADADLLFDAYYMNRQNFLGFEMARIFNDNLNFVLNSVEMLSGSPDLIHVRTRDITDRPFHRVKDLERQAETRWLAREQALLQRAEEASLRIQMLENQKQGEDALVLSEEQEAELRRFNEEKIRINQELKEVRRNLRSDIDALGTRLTIINMLAIPLLVAGAGIVLGIQRRRRSRQVME
ncbi:GldG family protein [Desulfobotulus sp. H1]|uniref:GldG family protein n=1 Tax=Desulfobotulus pelophilus TaxID=2823377 RepID=A0ABT3N6B1_9BACT|nr:GldG family protein [Desulfobotulus pelophilus]MCW7753003.1 GldG family protein [Desulfobotulus pelophilus]